MASGLIALLDDVAAIAKVAAASIDDIGAAASKAGVKAAGVVVDDAAVTPRYVTGFSPARELPIIWKITKGSLFNKLIIILPVIMLLSSFAQWAITPLLMMGGTYLCYEGAEKLWHAFHAQSQDFEAQAAEAVEPPHEEKMVSSAIRTDLILSAEIMVIALKEVMTETIWLRGATLALIGVGITVAVYGAVALIVKMDDIGLAMARTGTALRKTIGIGLVKGMPKLLALLGVVGTAAMLWVGGQIILHGLEEYNLGGPAHMLSDFANSIGAMLPVSGLWIWLVNAIGAGIFGALLGGVVLAVLHNLPTKPSPQEA